MTNFTVIAIPFIVFAWSRALLRYRDGLIKVTDFIFWSLLWLAAGVIVSVPAITTRLAISIGIGRGTDLVIYTSIIIILYLLFRLYVKISNVHREITLLVRASALELAEHKKR